MNTTKNISLFQKVITCGVAGVVAAYPLKRINDNYFPKWLPKASLPIAVWFIFIGYFSVYIHLAIFGKAK
jgi:hypothetical protein